jgi:NAD(P)-dependent dehydrogenase (short-subunit alcohol dehydrogenase family)
MYVSASSTRLEGTGVSARRRTVVVTGSASGMGAAVRRRLERAGVVVIGVDRRDAEVVADLGDGPQRRSACAKVSELAGGCLDGLVTCAGLGPHVQPLSDIIRVNYFGTVVLLDGLLPSLMEGDAPAAVVFASNAASLTPQHPALLEELSSDNEEGAAKLADALDGITVYGMSKLGVVRAMRRRASRWGGAGVRVNAVAPGPIETPMLEGILADPQLREPVEALPIPLERHGSPEDVAAAVGFLLDPSSRYVHGSTLFVDGGSDAQLRPDSI